MQGFGQRFVERRRDARHHRIRGNAISRYITFSVPKAAPRDAGDGLGLHRGLTGQDGFSSDQARGFQPTPQDFQFGVCATASSDPHCTFDPGWCPRPRRPDARRRPQSDELDYTLHNPVTIAPVVMP